MRRDSIVRESYEKGTFGGESDCLQYEELSGQSKNLWRLTDKKE